MNVEITEREASLILQILKQDKAHSKDYMYPILDKLIDSLKFKINLAKEQ